MKKRIRILVVDDHPIVRRGVTSCLASHEHLEIVGEAADGSEALAKARELRPDLILMDIEMPLMDGLAVTQLLQKELPKIRVLILSTHNGTDLLLRTMQAGAHGYILKGAPSDDLVRAIETVHSGESYFTADGARIAVDQFVRRNGDQANGIHLSKREREVLVQIAEGLSNKEMASHFGLGVRTIETHRVRIMCKLDIHSVAGLTRFALAKGLVSNGKEGKV